MKTARKILSPVSVAVCIAMLLLLLVDRVRPDLDLFLKEPVKWLLLAACAVVIASSAVRLADRRRRLRKRMARQQKV